MNSTATTMTRDEYIEKARTAGIPSDRAGHEYDSWSAIKGQGEPKPTAIRINVRDASTPMLQLLARTICRKAYRDSDWVAGASREALVAFIEEQVG